MKLHKKLNWNVLITLLWLRVLFSNLSTSLHHKIVCKIKIVYPCHFFFNPRLTGGEGGGEVNLKVYFPIREKSTVSGLWEELCIFVVLHLENKQQKQVPVM